MRSSFPIYVCPGCGVSVHSELGIVEGPDAPPHCIFCAEYDPDREDLAVLFLHDAQDDLLRRRARSSPHMGAHKDEVWKKPVRITFEAARAETAVRLNAFLKTLLDLLYEDARAGSPYARVRDQSKAVIDDVSRFIEAKLEADPGRTGSIIITDQLMDRYYAILDLLQNRYVIAHKKYIESVPDKETARFQSYGHFWNLGSLIRLGHLADRPAPWVTGAEKPRF